MAMNIDPIGFPVFLLRPYFVSSKEGCSAEHGEAACGGQEAAPREGTTAAEPSVLRENRLFSFSDQHRDHRRFPSLQLMRSQFLSGHYTFTKVVLLPQVRQHPITLQVRERF